MSFDDLYFENKHGFDSNLYRSFRKMIKCLEINTDKQDYFAANSWDVYKMTKWCIDWSSICNL